jgi:rhodanese-related sulfurtransferase
MCRVDESSRVQNPRVKIREMKEVFYIILKAIGIMVIFSLVGLGLNAVSSNGIPLIYTPPHKLVLAGTDVLLISEIEAGNFLNHPGTTFVDTRKEEDYTEKHVKGAVFLSPDNMEERFPEIQPLIPEENRLVLYCYGPECDMAERVALFLAQLGYKNMMIMTAGFRGWEKAGLPVDTTDRRKKRMGRLSGSLITNWLRENS